ncbi:PolC-type DNA polymerase III [Geosporobacter ferrireducens]|nr:PolC-type DNA polymerase III [Geosporobacter ferrireducens]
MNCLLTKVMGDIFSEKPFNYNAMIEKVTYNRSNKILNVVLVSEEIIHKRYFDEIKEHMIKHIPFIRDISFLPRYYKLKDQNEVLQNYWENILYELNKKMPSAAAWITDAEISFESSKMVIIVKDSIGRDNLLERKIDSFIREIYKIEFNKDIQVSIESTEVPDDEAQIRYHMEKERETQDLLKEILTATETQTPKKKNHISDPDKNIILGKKFQDYSIPIASISEESGIVVIEGEIFDIETRELKNGKILFTMSMTDYDSSIGAKIFAKKEQKDLLNETLHTGKYLRVKGDARYDTFSKEVVVMVNDIMEGTPTVREDLSKVKRIELHAHTQMSAMDGVTSASNLIKRAAKWGHPAIAITDHGVVQAFPEAMEAAKKHGIKVIYGIEGYLINDGETIAIGCKQETIHQRYVVFDIETTGLSSKHDKITEIGAVKIENGQIIDRFHTFVDPIIPIPENIVKLTGITDEMVKGQPTIDKILPEFLKFTEGAVIVAHNAVFDVSFIKENCHLYGYSFDHPIVDTLPLAKVLLPKLKKYRLNVVAEALDVTLKNHHRAVDDAEATAQIFLKFLNMAAEKGVHYLRDLNALFQNTIDIKKLDTFHIIILVKNATGLKNLYKIVSTSHLEYFYKKPRIPKSLLSKYREGLVIGTACEAGELYRSILNNRSQREIENIVKYYDYLEIQPLFNNKFLLDKGLVKDQKELIEINQRIVRLGEKYKKPVVATGDVHFLDPKDEVYRRILMSGQGFDDADDQTPLYLRTTEEMLEEFAYLGKDKAMDVVVNHPNRIAEEIDSLIPIPDETFPPIIEGSEEDLRKMCYEKATRIYGDPLPEVVQKRLDRELNSIINNGYAVMYIIAQKLVTKSLRDGYLVGSRGSVGSSFVATMSDITEVNPLPPHYVCSHCKHSEFILDGSIGSGADLPDKHCPGCSKELIKDGHDIPFEVFLGFEGDKEPDIDLNFAGEYQANAHKYTEELFGTGYVFRAGTIGTIAEKTAYGFVKKYFDEKGIFVNNREISRLVKGCTGVKRTTGQHPGGVMVVPNYKEIYDFCPIQYPANDGSSGVITTHFDYHSISGRLLKLDILGHDVPTIIRMLQDLTGLEPTQIPLDDQETVKIFTSLEPLKIVYDDFECETGSLGIPEFGTKFVRQMLVDTKPTTFAELVRISGLSHGTDVWLNNAQDLVRQGIAELKDVISTRDDIMNYLIYKGLPPKSAFKIMENVRKGKGLNSADEEIMKQNNVPQWYINSCNKIKYMFPKAHAAAYVMMSFRIAYFKVHYPLAFYATYFTTKASDFDAELVAKGREHVRDKIKELESLGNNASQKEKDLLTVLEVVHEMYCRGFGFCKVDLYESDAERFKISGNNLLPPIRALQGVGENAARSICESRKEGEFISLQHLRESAKLTKTVIETLQTHGCLEGLPDTNQLSLF